MTEPKPINSARKPQQAPWQASVLTLFPDAFPGVLGASIIGSALKDEKWALEAIDIRDFSYNKHRSVDASPAGGGPGMVLTPEVSARAIDSVRDSVARKADETVDTRPLIYLTPRGKPLTQKRVRELASGSGVIVFCGRFEGLDQRVIEARNMEEVCVGDFILAGGEVAAQAMIEACVRLLPGVLGDISSTEEESFEDGLLEYPLYAKPREWEDRKIPEVLLSGDHKKIAMWRQAEMEKITKERRPDMWEIYMRDKMEK
ncbi:MAG TPA: tRNA (guanosine(37)-N1)-methyltransferase TrmD [Hellea balneolensis]|uniref:tRNA (guanine-N(1)-)-methyltransferase n=1 Tax=Hellea balneolensis TaxID=287478 RepID=A0A7C3G5V9_9PROT|nr:tRNA (guanosine(37)-N1)-methyltransferase TrmD [Hellea balneolensis]